MLSDILPYCRASSAKVRHPISMEEERKAQVSGPVERNIRSVAKLERDREEQQHGIDRFVSLIGTFAGSKLSIALHLLVLGFWLLVNTGHVSSIHPFDPLPFSLLGFCFSTEAIFLSIFVLLKQNHMQHRDDHLSQLNLQIDLLTEKELTKALQLLRALCIKLDVGDPLQDAELSEMSQVTSVGTLAERILTDLPPKV